MTPHIYAKVIEVTPTAEIKITECSHEEVSGVLDSIMGQLESELPIAVVIFLRLSPLAPWKMMSRWVCSDDPVQVLMDERQH